MADDVQQLVAQVSAEFRSFKNDMRKVVKIAQDEMKRTEDANKKAAKASEDAWKGALGRIKGYFGAYLGVQALKGLGQTITAALDAAAAIKDVANAANVSTKYLQEMRYAAAQNGASAEDLDDALTALNTRLGDFRTSGGGAVFQTLEQLGLAADVMNGKFVNTEDAADAILRALANVKSNADRTAMAADLFGKAAGPKLAEFLTVGERGIAAARAEAERLGLVISDDMINGADEASDKLNALWQTLETAGVAAIAANADAILGLAESFAQAMPGILEYMRQFLQYWGVIERSPVELAQRAVDLTSDRKDRARALLDRVTKTAEMRGLKVAEDNPVVKAYIDALKADQEARAKLGEEIAKFEAQKAADEKAALDAPKPTGPGRGAGGLKEDAKNAAALAKELESAATAMAALNAEILGKARDLNADAFEDYLAQGRQQFDANLDRNEEDLGAWDRQFDHYADGLEDAISDVLMGEDLDDAGEYFAKQFARSVADEMGLEVKGILKNLLRGSEIGGGGGVIGWLTRGVASLVGGMKGNAFVGPLAWGKGFSGGGYTGNIPRGAIAGPAHGQEYVFDAASTQRIGVPTLDAIRAGRQIGGGDVTANFYGVSQGDIPAMKEMMQQIMAQQAAQQNALPRQVRAIVRDAVVRKTA